MKSTFNNLSLEKKQRIIKSCIEEFGEHGYDSSSVNRIIKRAGISKGGLYEYVSSKEELFIYTVNYACSSLFSYLEKRINMNIHNFQDSLMNRLKLVSELTIDFYIDNPDFIYLIVRTSYLLNKTADAGIQDIFRSHFLNIFKNSESSELIFPKEQILELIMWLFLKTQIDFLNKMETEKDLLIIKKDYLEKWKYYLEMMENGIIKV